MRLHTVYDLGQYNVQDIEEGNPNFVIARTNIYYDEQINETERHSDMMAFGSYDGFKGYLHAVSRELPLLVKTDFINWGPNSDGRHKDQRGISGTITEVGKPYKSNVGCDCFISILSSDTSIDDLIRDGRESLMRKAGVEVTA